MRIAFVVVRYGLDVHGGAEYHCREWAERLAPRHHVEIFTSCARDYVTWADYYAPGVEFINGVRVQRFRVDTPRDNDSFNAFSHIVFGGLHTNDQEVEWMRRQGPYSTSLFSAIAVRHADFDLFIFMTYLYCTTYFGLPLVQDKAILVPTAHDELPIYLQLFQPMFKLPRYLIYNTPTERTMLHQLFDIASLPGSEVGVGIDVPSFRSTAPESSPPLLLYVGRVDTSKGCEQLYDYFLRYKQAHPSPFQLAFAGRADITLPPHPDVQMLGFISEERKRELLAQCALVVLPSPFESLSILCLEAWAAAKPTLVNGTTLVLRDQTLRSNGGLFYQDYAEFAACLDLLLADHQLRQQLGRQGRSFVEQWYSWPVVEERLEAALTQAVRLTTGHIS